MTNYITDFHTYVKTHPAEFGKKIHTLCGMIDKLLARKDIAYKPAQVESFIKFCGLFQHTEGKQWVGKPIELAREQKWICACVLGIKRYDKNYSLWVRYFREMRIFVARKWGKSEFFALLLLFVFLADKETGSQCFNFATNRKQARIVYDKCLALLRQRPELFSMIKTTRIGADDAILNQKTNSFLTYGSKAKRGKDGTSPNVVGIDECHEITDHNIYDSQSTGQGAILQPLLVCISTAGTTKGSLHSRFYAEAEALLLKKKFDDDLPIFPAVFEIDVDDDVKNDKCWIKANPGLKENRPSLASLRTQYKKALIDPSGNGIVGFITKNLNRVCDEAQSYIELEKVKKCAIDIKPEDYYDTYAYGGVDLAEFTDLANSTSIIPLQHEEDPDIFDFIVLQRYYMPEKRLEKNSESDKVQYGKFTKTKSNDPVCSELLRLCPGDIVNFKEVAGDFRYMQDTYSVLYRKVGYDKWRSGQFLIAMQDLGFKEEKRLHSADGSLTLRDDGQMTEVRQGKHLSDMIRWLKTLIEEGRIKFDRNNLLLPMCISNAKVSIDKDNLWQIEKRDSTGRIDGLLGLLDALRAFDCDKAAFVSQVLPYESRNKKIKGV